MPLPRWYSNRCDGAVAIDPAEEAVRDELLEAGVGFHFAAGTVLDVVAFDEVRPVAVDLAREALEVSQFAKQAGGDDEDSFLGDESTWQILPGVRCRTEADAKRMLPLILLIQSTAAGGSGRLRSDQVQTPPAESGAVGER